MSCRPYAYLSALIAALGGFLQSYAASVIAGAILFLSPEFGLSPAQEGLAAAMILIGALFGSTFASNLADRLGRKKTLLISAWLFCISNLPVLFTHSFSMLLTLRFITGIAAGISSLTVPLYLAEIAPPSKRGAFVSFFQLLVTIGTLVAYFINLVLISSGNWREMLFFTVIPAIIQGIALLFVPESPKWLFGKGLVEESAETLRSLHEENGFALQASFNELGGTWKTVLAPFFRKGIWLGVALVVFQQWCGINAIVYFAPKIFQSGSPLSPKEAMMIAFSLGCVNCIATLISLAIIDRWGRRKLLLASACGVSASLILFTALFLTSKGGSSSFAILSLGVYIVSYSIGLGPITWVLVSEIYPLVIRAKAIALMAFLSWLSNFTVVQTFPSLLAHLGSFWTFSIYTISALVALYLFWRYVPETKGKSLEEIEQTFYG